MFRKYNKNNNVHTYVNYVTRKTNEKQQKRALFLQNFFLVKTKKLNNEGHNTTDHCSGSTKKYKVGGLSTMCINV